MPRTMNKVLLFTLLFCLSLPAAARMYQWIDPESGTTQLSGKPPVWYRSGEGGPRVVVFEQGQVVDDTGIEVSEPERQRLRQRALVGAEDDRQQARRKLLEAKRLKALSEKERQEEREEVAPPEEVAEFVPEPETEDDNTGAAEQRTAEAMRELIREWERLRTEDAREAIGSGQTPGGQRPPSPRDDAPPPPPPSQ